jgi:hypothetical protein
MNKLKEKQRVNNNFLGSGTVVKTIKGTSKKVFAYMVLYDINPPKEYNGGNNPCLSWAVDLHIL